MLLVKLLDFLEVFNISLASIQCLIQLSQFLFILFFKFTFLFLNVVDLSLCGLNTLLLLLWLLPYPIKLLLCDLQVFLQLSKLGLYVMLLIFEIGEFVSSGQLLSCLVQYLVNLVLLGLQQCILVWLLVYLLCYLLNCLLHYIDEWFQLLPYFHL